MSIHFHVLCAVLLGHASAGCFAVVSLSFFGGFRMAKTTYLVARGGTALGDELFAKDPLA
ncbi:hypothetical protein BP00DRAFT_423825 [Aspergillus indologenus CBS 114.80]|uniref:Uncharacterized protein n=1 Tax=Aspergillus indologenus CBS 114.80 TaxID=1450541 RepID=A0A2V5JDD9_9EURO|nr:hypothetical protein BP00DRAFT_423825 [Aspergillus indologenus CBS 114.80]